MFTFQTVYVVMGVTLVLAALMFRGALVVAMRRSSYDRFSYFVTWVVVSPALLLGVVLLWLGAVGSGA